MHSPPACEARVRASPASCQTNAGVFCPAAWCKGSRQAAHTRRCLWPELEVTGLLCFQWYSASGSLPATTNTESQKPLSKPVHLQILTPKPSPEPTSTQEPRAVLGMSLPPGGARRRPAASGNGTVLTGAYPVVSGLTRAVESFPNWDCLLLPRRLVGMQTDELLPLEAALWRSGVVPGAGIPRQPSSDP